MSVAYIIGAGVSGLACGKRLAEQGYKTAVFEATDHPGGRCRTFFDEKLGLEIDNGTHLVLSGNSAILQMADKNQLHISASAKFNFKNLKTGADWVADMGCGKIPWMGKTPPGVSMWNLLGDYRKLNCDAAIGDVLDSKSLRWENLWMPLILAIMNTPPLDASARLMRAVLSQSLLKGGYSSRPVMMKNGLSKALINPVASSLEIKYGAMLKAIQFDGSLAAKLIFKDFEINLENDDVVVLAVPWGVAHDLYSEIPPAPEFNPIINVHFKTNAHVKTPEMTGLLGGVSHWLFRRENVASVTISAANQMVAEPSEKIANQVWSEISQLVGGGEIPPWRVIKEKSATFAATPHNNGLRPQAITKMKNLFLAGDWTDTGLPATLEGSARSGFVCADAAIQVMSV